MVSLKKAPTKKLLAVALAVLMVLSTIPVGLFTTVFAAQVDELIVEFESYNKTATITLTQSDDETKTQTVEAANGKAIFEGYADGDKIDDEKAHDIYISNLIGYADIEAKGQLCTDSKFVIPDSELNPIEQTKVTGSIKDENSNGANNVTVKYSAYDGKLTGEIACNDGEYSFDAYIGINYTVKYVVDNKYDVVNNQEITPLSDVDNTLDEINLVVKTFNITTVAENGGTITESINDVQYGDTKTITIEADKGYRIGNVTGLDGNKSYAGEQKANVIIENIQRNYDIKVTFYKQTYVVKFDVGKNGEVTYDTDKIALGGTVTVSDPIDEFGTVEFTAKSNIAEGYHIKNVTGSDNRYDKNENSKTEYKDTISNITEDKTVIVTFAINTYSVKTNANENGKVIIDDVETNDKTVNYGDSSKISVAPDDGYYISKFEVNGIDKLSADDSEDLFEYAIENITEDKNITAEFSKKAIANIDNIIDNEYFTATFTEPNVINGNECIVGGNGSVIISPKDGNTIRIIKDKIWFFGYHNTYYEGETEFTKDKELKVEVKNGHEWISIDTSIDFKVDTKAPKITKITKEPIKDYHNDSYKVTVEVSDNLAGVEKVLFSAENDITKAEEADYTIGRKTATFITTTDEYNGDYYIWAVDRVDNASEPSKEFIGIDKTVPTVDKFEFESSSLNATEFGTYSNSDITVSISASDDDSSTTNSGVKSITFNGETKDVLDGKAKFILKAEDFTEGKAVSATALDNAGNPSVVTIPNNDNSNVKSNIVTISNTVASIDIAKSSQMPQYNKDTQIWYDGNNSFTVKVSDEFGIKAVDIFINGKAVDLNGDTDGTTDICDNGATAVKEKTYTINTSENSLDGKNEIEIKVNNVNNNSSSNNDVVYIDTTKPDVIGFEFTSKGTTALEKALNFLTFGIFFNEKIEIKVTAEDKNASAGLKEVTLYGDKEALDTKPIIDGVATFELPAEAIADETMHLNKEISAKATDNVDNVTTDFVYPTTTNSDTFANSGLMIETIDPIINVSFPEAASGKNTATADTNKWYAEDIDFNINITDSDSGIRKVEIDINGKAITTDKDSKNIVESFNEKSEKTTTLDFRVNTDQATIKEDGSYTITVKVTDTAGNETLPYTETVYKDADAPSIIDFNFEATGYDKDEAVTATNQAPVQETSYGFYFIEDTKVTVTSHDVVPTAGVKSITYYTVDKDGGKSEEITALVDKDNKIVFTIPANFKGQIYAKATDNVGNTPEKYSNPNSAVVESPEQHEKSNEINYTLAPTEFKDADGNNLYASTTKVDVEVIDSYSGIRQIDWEVVAPYDDKKQAGTVTVNNDGVVTSEAKDGFSAECLGEWNATLENNLVINLKNTITVSNNSNNIQIKFTLTDRAGNVTKDVIQTLSIDKTAPKIVIQMNENDDEKYSGFFKTDRTAEIFVYERNFKSEDLNYVVSRVDDNESKSNVKITPDFKKIDETVIDGVECYVYKMSYKFTNDGDYKFSVNAKDFVGNEIVDDDVKYSPDKTTDYSAQNDNDRAIDTKFTIDKTPATITVSYDNNEAQNEKFFKAHRTATVTIVEHNFDVDRVIFTRTATISGNSIALPSVSWSHSGNTHIATINYNADGDYTFDVTMTDKAGNKEANVNYGSSVAAKDFTVDTTYSDIVKVEGIANKGILGLVNGDIDADAKVNITINDVNLDNYNIKLTRSRVLVTGESDETEDASQGSIIDNPETQAESGIDVTSKFVSNASGSVNATAVISIPKKDENGVKNDGLYTLTIEAKDKAGNAYDTNANIITFSVNRFGSVFTFSNDLYKLLNDNDGYTQSVESTDLTVYEYNATAINNETVEVIANNESKTLIKSADYTVKTDNQQDAGSWSKNTYKIRPENFKNDGVYTLRLSSKDAASITSQTVDYDVCSATFRVDSTPADIISVNYSTEVEKMLIGDTASAKTDKLTVNFTVEDLIRLEKIEVYINDVLDKTYIYGKDFDDFNTFDGGQFVINDGGAKTQIFKIVVTDKAGNVIDTSNKEQYKPGYVFFDQLVVSPNAFAQFYANKALFFGSIGGVALVAGIIIFVVVKKRKKDDDEENTNSKA